jgi:hypothetical protein
MVVKSEQSIRERREENLQAMRSVGSLLLAGGALLTILVAFLFYDHPIIENPVLLTYLQGAFFGTIQ